MKPTTEVYPWESKTTLVALLGTLGSLLAAAGVINLTAEQISALGIVIFPLVMYLRKRSKGAKVVLSKNVLLVLLVLLAGMFPAMAITPTIPDYQQAYQEALWLNDYGLWKGTTMLPIIERATANPEYLPAFVLKANIWNQLGNSTIAIQAAQHVIDRAPTNSDAWLEMGKAYKSRAWTQRFSPFLRDQYAESMNQTVAALTNATLSDPSNEEAWKTLGEAYTDLGQKEAARDAYLEVLKIDPYDAIASAAIRR